MNTPSSPKTRRAFALLGLTLVSIWLLTVTASPLSAQTPTLVADSWVFPLKPWDDFDIAQNFGRATFPGLTDQYHPGIDVLKKSGQTAYLPVYAAANGVVAYVCNSTTATPDCQGFGKAVLVNHVLPSNQALPDGTTRVTSIYGHLQVSDSMPIAKLGTQVKKGETIVGYIADQDHCGDICQGAHLHFGIRKGNFGESGFPNSAWGYVPLTNSTEISNWLNPIEFIKSHPSATGLQGWRSQIKSDNFLPWWYTFYICDNRRIKAYFDSSMIFHTSSEDGDQTSSSATIFSWPPGKHIARVEFFDSPDSSPADLRWSPFPSRPACASEPVVMEPTQTPTLPTARLVSNTPALTPLIIPTATAARLTPILTPSPAAPAVSANDLEIVKKGLIRCRVAASSTELSNDFFALFELQNKRKDIKISGTGVTISLVGSSGVVLNSAKATPNNFEASTISPVIPSDHFAYKPLSSNGSKVEDIRLDFGSLSAQSVNAIPESSYSISLASHEVEASMYPRHSIVVQITNNTNFGFDDIAINGAIYDLNGNLVDILASKSADSRRLAYGSSGTFTAASLSQSGRCVGRGNPTGYTLDYWIQISSQARSAVRYFSTKVR